MDTIQAMKQALAALSRSRPNGVGPETARLHIEAITNLRAAIEQMEKAEPVAWLPSDEWTPCVKLPVTVHVRKQREGETHVSTREGITPVKPDDLIMRGVSGEEYPIGRAIFEQTYRIGEAHPAPAVPFDENFPFGPEVFVPEGEK